MCIDNDCRVTVNQFELITVWVLRVGVWHMMVSGNENCVWDCGYKSRSSYWFLVIPPVNPCI